MLVAATSHAARAPIDSGAGPMTLVRQARATTSRTPDLKSP